MCFSLFFDNPMVGNLNIVYKCFFLCKSSSKMQYSNLLTGFSVERVLAFDKDALYLLLLVRN